MMQRLRGYYILQIFTNKLVANNFSYYMPIIYCNFSNYIGEKSLLLIHLIHKTNSNLINGKENKYIFNT